MFQILLLLLCHLFEVSPQRPSDYENDNNCYNQECINAPEGCRVVGYGVCCPYYDCSSDEGAGGFRTRTYISNYDDNQNKRRNSTNSEPTPVYLIICSVVAMLVPFHFKKRFEF